jgi:hypothetical protein
MTVSQQPLGIPYHREVEDAGGASYIDLKREPQRIGEIPEAKQWPSLHRLLMQLNAPESRLMSTGCGAFIYPPQTNGQPQWSAYAYIGYCFADLSEISDARAYFPQFFHFSQHYAVQTGTAANVFFELRPTGFIERDAQGFSVDYVVRPWASSEEQLNASIAVHLDALADFLPLMGLTPMLTPAS